jgi:hypothetical protein
MFRFCALAAASSYVHADAILAASSGVFFIGSYGCVRPSDDFSLDEDNIQKQLVLYFADPSVFFF